MPTLFVELQNRSRNAHSLSRIAVDHDASDVLYVVLVEIEQRTSFIDLAIQSVVFFLQFTHRFFQRLAFGLAVCTLWLWMSPIVPALDRARMVPIQELIGGQGPAPALNLLEIICNPVAVGPCRCVEL